MLTYLSTHLIKNVLVFSSLLFDILSTFMEIYPTVQRCKNKGLTIRKLPMWRVVQRHKIGFAPEAICPKTYRCPKKGTTSPNHRVSAKCKGRCDETNSTNAAHSLGSHVVMHVLPNSQCEAKFRTICHSNTYIKPMDRP